MTQQRGPAMIEAQGLSKYYGEFAAILDVTFQVRQGEVVAFLGPNGAGKSTTLKLLTGYLAPSAGVARIAGHDMSTDRLAGSARLGYLPENGPLYPDMTPRSLLKFFADARGLTPARKRERIAAVVELCSLGQRHRQADRKALARLSAARGHGPSVAPRTRRVDPRRADRRLGPQPDSRGAGDDPQVRPEQDDPAFHPHFARGGGDGRPGVVHQRGPNLSSTAPIGQLTQDGKPLDVAFPRTDGGLRKESNVECRIRHSIACIMSPTPDP